MAYTMLQPSCVLLLHVLERVSAVQPQCNQEGKIADLNKMLTGIEEKAGGRCGCLHVLVWEPVRHH